MLKPTKILAPTDFSSHSDRAIRESFDLAREYGAEVYVLHVVEERIGSALRDDYSDIAISMATIKRRQNKLLKAAKNRLEKQVEKILPKGKIKIFQEVVIGIPSEEIIRFQTEKKIDLIVISSLGRTGLAKYFIGSVARNVLKGSTCTVLLSKSS